MAFKENKVKQQQRPIDFLFGLASQPAAVAVEVATRPVSSVSPFSKWIGMAWDAYLCALEVMYLS